MTPPKLVVLTTGRSGSQSLTRMLEAAGVDVRHEPNGDPVLMVSNFWHSGRFTDGEAMGLLSHSTIEWPEVVVDFGITPLAALLARYWEDTKFVILVRHPEPTVRSMVRRMWYSTVDDTAAPVYRFWYQRGEQGMAQRTDLNYPGLRVRGDRVQAGGVSALEWAGMDAPERCAWWWNWSMTVASFPFIQADEFGPGKRCQLIKLEDENLPGVFGLSGEFPHVNRMATEDLEFPNDRWRERVRPVAEWLGYDL